jgi:hypothetical protein
MRRLLCAALLVASTFGIFVVPASADDTSGTVLLSFDYSDNTAPPSVSNGSFNVIVDVLPGDAAGLVRMFAVAPAVTNDPNIVCHFQWISESQAECAFNFPDPGVWAIHAQYVVAPQTDVVAVAKTNLRVDN